MTSPRLRTALAACIAVVLVAGIVAAVGRGETEVPADGAVVHLAGVATVTHPGEEPATLHDGDTVRPDDEVELASGTMVLQLAGGGSFEGRVGADGTGTRVVLGSLPELVQGDLLVSGGEGLAVTAAGTVATLGRGGGIARVQRGLSVLAGVYAGSLGVESGGQEREVPAFRQLGIASLGRPSARPEPYQYDAGDTWDQRFLGSAIELSVQLDSMSHAFSANVRRGEGHTAAGYELILPDLDGEADFDDTDVAGTRDPGDLLVGATIAVLGRDASFQARWDRLFAFRDEGAAWGLVALDEAVDSVPVLGQVQQAIDRYSQPPAGQVASPPVTTPSTPGTSGTTPSTGGSSTTPPTAAPPTSRPTTPTTAPTTPTSPPFTPPTLPTPTVPDAPATGIPIIDDVTQSVDDILGGLLGGGSGG